MRKEVVIYNVVLLTRNFRGSVMMLLQGFKPLNMHIDTS